MEKCNHPAFNWGQYGGSLGARCRNCHLTVLGKTSAEILNQFHPKEKTMSTIYDAGFKAGVEQATQPLYLMESSSNGYFASEINGKLNERRKTLLTKKVTKYAIVCSRWRNKGEGEQEQYVYGDLSEDRGAAQREASALNAKGYVVFGVFPIEIEIPL